MKKTVLTLNDIFELPTAVIYNPDSYVPVSAFTIDSRNVPAGSMFIAIKGKKFDGHKYVKDAVKLGAAVVVINEKKLRGIDENVNCAIITVKDTVKALGDIAGLWRRKINTKIIGITGSSGKTSTKEMLALLLSEKYSVNKTWLNNNNHIGVPMTILATNNKHDFLVLELGTNHFGEIPYTAAIARPDYALITNIGSSHLEFLRNRKGVLKEKSALFEAAAENNGTLFVNSDDKLLANAARVYPDKITFGMQSGADVSVEITGYTEEGRPLIKLRTKKFELAAEMPVFGEVNAQNFCAAAAVAYKAGIGKREMLAGIKKLKAAEKRFNIKKLGEYTIVDDTYNANPDSMRYALRMTSKIFRSKTKTAVLGDMFELGEDQVKHHKNLAKEIKKAGYQNVFLIGKLMKNVFMELSGQKNINTKHFISRSQLKKELQKMELKNTVVLLKGSRGMKMEEFVKVLEERSIN